MPMAAMASGVKTRPSVSSAMGASSRKETMVMREKVLIESMEPLPARWGWVGWGWVWGGIGVLVGGVTGGRWAEGAMGQETGHSTSA